MGVPLRSSIAMLFLVVAAKAGAQASASETAGFQAVILTPIGALPQVLHVPSADSVRRFAMELLYGRYRFKDNSALFHNVGLGVRFQVLHRVSIGATLGNRGCGGCEGLKMAGADLQADVWSQNSAEFRDGRAYLGLRLSAGIGEPNKSHFNARLISGSLPLAVTLPQARGSELTLFFSPALAYGYINDGGGTILGYSGGDGATRFLIGAGIGYQVPAGFGAHAALHRVVIEDSPTQVGFGVSWSFGKGGRRHGQYQP